MVSGSELKRLFYLAFDDEILRFIAQHIHDSYADAIERAASLDREYKRRAIPQIRHYIIQSRMRYIVKHFPQVTAEIDFSDGHEPYTVLRCDNFYLTVSMAKHPGELPRESHFRSENATDNLFESIDPKKVDSFYSIISHVPEWDNSAPRHLAALFPDYGYSGVYDAIDLTPLIDFDLEAFQPPSEDIDAPEPTLRKRIPKTKKEA
jgi:hypothetical protein